MTFQQNISDGVAELQIDHPTVNALGPDQFYEFSKIVTELGDNPLVRVLIIHAAGRGYCAGIDIKALADKPDSISHVNRSAYRAFAAIHHCKVPVISAVHGFALGAGAAMVGASDIIFAAAGTKFGLPEIKVGMLGGASHMLRMLPLQKVRGMYFTGEPICAEEMYRLGAVESVVPKEDLLETARDFAKRIAVNSATGLRFAKEALNGIEPVDLETDYRYEQGFTFEISHLDAGRDARTAFAENNTRSEDE